MRESVPPSMRHSSGPGGNEAATIRRDVWRVTPRPGKVARLAPVLLLVFGAMLIAVDVALAIRPVVSVALTTAQVLLALPWLASVVRPGALRAGLAPISRARASAIAAVPVFLLALCVAAKWRVLEVAETSELARFLPMYRTYAALELILFVLGVVGPLRIERFLVAMSEYPARLMVVSFGLTALLGGIVLTLPVSLRDITTSSFVDGFFTAVSAVCVTGLAVNNVPETYTPFGQGVILALVQVGGLGIMVLSAFFTIVAGRRMRVRSAAVMAEMIDSESLAGFRRNVGTIVAFTLIIETIGAALLYWRFRMEPEVARVPSESLVSGAGDPLWAAIFHAVSAFCNAGFSVFQGNMTGFVDSGSVCGVIMALIFLGGLGFPVLDELARNAFLRVTGTRPPRLSLHARTALVTSAVLLVLGFVVFLGLEWSRTMADHSIPTKILAAAFQSVLTRTAGFNSLDFAAMHPATLVCTMILMFLGGSPGSTAGGIKTTTLAVLFASLRAELRGYEAVRLLQRSVGEAVVRRASGLTLLSVALVSGFTLLLLLVEPHDPLALAFEACSAFGTVGLSMSLTPKLGVAGKLIVAAAMFAGRIGPLTLALALATRSASQGLRLPEERIVVG